MVDLSKVADAINNYANSPEGQRTLNLAFGLPSDVAANVQAEREYFKGLENQQKVQDVFANMGGRITDDMIAQIAQAGDPNMALKLYEMRQNQMLKEQEQKMMQDALSGGVGGDVAPYILAESDNPMMAGIAQSQLANKQEQRIMDREERAAQREEAKNQRELAEQIAREKRNPSDAQSKAFTFAQRMQGAKEALTGDKINALIDPVDSSLDNVPLVGNYLVSDEYQQAKQAMEDWVTANLRKESGAVIGDSEMEKEVKKYFPVVGDNPQTIEQKRKSREQAERGMIKSAGVLADEIDMFSGDGEGLDLSQARQAPDGNFYIEKNGQFFKVEQ